MDYTLDDWKGSDIGSSIGDDGEIVEDSDLARFVVMGMDREATVGTMSAEVCKADQEYNSGGFLDDIIKNLVHFFQDVVGLYSVCQETDPNLATGVLYSFTEGQDENLKLYSGYMLHNEVYSLLSDQDSSVSVLREKYYAKHPRDESEAGEIARISGMTKHEAEIALAYGEYLNEIASYDASSRYQFGEISFNLESTQPILKTHSNSVASELLAWYQKETEYEDLRSRNFVV